MPAGMGWVQGGSWAEGWREGQEAGQGEGGF